MSNDEMRPIPNGRLRIIRLLTENQKAALRTIKTDGLQMLNLNETEIVQPETWIEYWFDKDIITEDELRSQIDRIILDFD